MRKVLILILLWTTQSLAAQSNTMVFGTSENPPYIDSRRADGGLLVAINRAALEAVGWKLTIKDLPPQRIINELRSGALDGTMFGNSGINHSEFFYSEPTLLIPMVVVVHRDSPLKMLVPNSLQGLRIGSVRGYGVENSFPELSFDFAPDPEANLLKLINRRIDAIIDTEFSMVELVKNLGIERAQPIRILSPPLRSMVLGTVFSDRTLYGQEYRELFNHGLAIIKRNGKYQTILRAYQATLQSNLDQN